VIVSGGSEVNYATAARTAESIAEQIVS